MAEQTFRSPGFFEQEIDLTGRTTSVEGTPAGIIGTSEKGPAFVPITLGTQRDFEQTFGSLDPKRFAPYAVQQWLQNRTAVTFTRILGAGANTTTTNIANTQNYGVVKNAGFVISGAYDDTGATDGLDLYKRARGVTKFIVANHEVHANETLGYPVFTDNDSFDLTAAANTGDYVNLVRAMMLFPTGTTALLSPCGGTSAPAISGITPNSVYVKNAKDSAAIDENNDFLLILSSSANPFVNELANEGGNKQVKIFSASLNPASANYISKILNTDPTKFQTEQHLLYADFLVENELATATQGVAILSGALIDGSKSPPGTAGKYQDLFGRFDTRYTTPTTTQVVSQPFGKTEYNLFRFETLDDGAYGNSRVKISISNLVASNDETNKFGKFNVQVRKFTDTDTKPEILEQFSQCSLDPTSDRYIARLIGDKKVAFDFDAELDDERRLVVSGKYPNMSKYIRVLPAIAVEDGDVPDESLPFGFRGIPTLKTTDSLTAFSGSVHGALTALRVGNRVLGSPGVRLFGAIGDRAHTVPYGSPAELSASLTSSIVPPLPMRFKVTRGPTVGTNYEGDPGSDERVDARFHWGVKFERMAETASLANPALNPNVSSTPNPLVSTYTKFLGIEKLDTLVTGSGADAFNNNMFTLAKVGLGPDADVGTPTSAPTQFTQITGTAAAHMKGAVYVRNGVLENVTAGSKTQEYVVSNHSVTNRVTLATLLASSSVTFNRFTPFAKFTLPFYGGFDGFNILDPDIQFGNDKATSQEGKAGSSAYIGLSANLYDSSNTNPMGAGLENSSIASFRTAVRLNTDPFIVYTNLLAVPDIKEPLVTDYAGDKVKEYSKAMYIMDTPAYGMKDGTTSTRLFGGDSLRPDVAETAEQFAGRGLDNNYVTTYFPSVIIDDTTNNRRVTVPPSIAALGAIGFNDRVSYPWFAPAGFNRGALQFVKNVKTRLSQGDRDTLYDNRINPIATFPTGGFVIFGQKTLQQAATALDRVNVRRMLLEVKRLVGGVARNLLFEQNNATTRNRFVAQITPLLALVQAQAGIESFQIVCNESNNTDLDAEQNKMNGRIVVVPTRAIEFIAIDFIITNAGVSFE